MQAGRFDSILLFSAIFLGVSFAFSDTDFSFTDIAIVFAAGTVIVHWAWRRNWLWPLERKDQRIVLYFSGIVALGSLFLPFNNLEFGLITLYLAGLFFVARYLRELGYTHNVLKAYAIAAFLSAFYGITWWSWGRAEGERFQFFFDDPSVYGAFLVPATLFYMWRVLARSHDIGYRTLNLFAASVIYSALFLTLSRGAWLHAGVALGVLLVIMLIARQFDRASFKVLGGGVVIVCIGGALMSNALTDIMITGQAALDETRIENFSYALTAISDFSTREFMIGSGNGSYDTIAPFTANNTYVRLLFENGFLGLGLFGFLILGVLYKNRNEFTKPGPAILLASLAGILAHSLVIDTLHWRHFWLILGLL